MLFCEMSDNNLLKTMKNLFQISKELTPMNF